MLCHAFQRGTLYICAQVSLDLRDQRSCNKRIGAALRRLKVIFKKQRQSRGEKGFYQQIAVFRMRCIFQQDRFQYFTYIFISERVKQNI